MNFQIKKFNMNIQGNCLLFGNYNSHTTINSIINGSPAYVVTDKELQYLYKDNACKFLDSWEQLCTVVNLERNQHMYVVLDNCFYDETWLTDKFLQMLLRNKDISVIISLPYVLSIPHRILCNIYYIIIQYDIYLKNKKIISTHFLNDVLHLSDLMALVDIDSIFDAVFVNKNDSIVLDNQVITTATERLIYWG